MTEINDQNNTVLLRFDKGEEVLTKLQEYCDENKIVAGSFHALGAAGEVVLSYYNLDKKIYEDTTLSEDVEIASMIGNIAVMNDTYIIHSHGVFGRRDFSTVGGHIKSLVVSATCEVTLTVFDKEMKRAFNEETGLNLLS